MPEQDGIELRTYIAVLRRWWWLILGCTLLAGAAAYIATDLRPPKYKATATLLIQPAVDARTSEFNLLVAGERLALTYTQMIIGQPVLEAVISDLELEEKPEIFARRITAVPIRDTQLIRLEVMDTSPAHAAMIANSVAEAFTVYTQTLNTQRYAASLDSMQEKIDQLSAAIEETQTQVDTQSASKIVAEANLKRLESLLVESRNEYRVLQQDLKDLQLTVDLLIDEVNVAEPAYVSEEDLRPPYTATVTLILTNEQFVPTYIQMLSGRSVLQAVIAQLELTESPETLANKVTVSPVRGTQLIKIDIKDDDTTKAVLLADSIAGEFIRQNKAMLAEPYSESLTKLKSQMDELSGTIDQIEGEIDSLTTEKIQYETELARLENLLAEDRGDQRVLLQDNEQLLITASGKSDTITVAEPAQIPDLPVQSRKLINTLLATVSGAFMGIGLAFLLEYLDDTIKTPQDISLILGVKTIGGIPRVKHGKDELVSMTQPRSPSAEAFRMLKNNLRLSDRDKPFRTILVTSPSPEEGKSVVAANLAVTMAASGLSVVIVDADLYRPRLGELFNLKSSDGLTGCLLDGAIDGRLQASEVDGLSVITSGNNLPSYPAELLGSHSMGDLFDQLSSRADLTLIDSPPVLSLADAAVIATLVDGVLLVLKSGRTRPAAAQQAVSQLQHVGANLVGVALNAIPPRSGTYNYYYHDYYHPADDGDREQVNRPMAFLTDVRDWFQSKH